jgi:Ca2+-binding RTX toxin-like protein
MARAAKASPFHFQGTAYATSRAEAFDGDGLSDTVSYENAPSSGSVGQYDKGVTVNLASPSLNTGWAAGDTYFGVEKITGSQYTDFLYGDAKANIFDGGGSPDFIYGRDGNDTILGSGGFDQLYGEGGNDLLNGQQQTDTLYGGDGDDQMWGGSNYVTHYYPGTNYADVLYGDAGNDQLHGDALITDRNMPSEYYEPLDLMPGRDELHGGSGNDTLNGDGGNDSLWGDTGADQFIFDAPYTVKDAVGADMRITSGDDVVMDFNYLEGDHLNFSHQGYATADSASGMVITLLNPDGSVEGHVTLAGVHTFDSAWVM